MTRWYVGVKHDGRREVFAEPTGIDPTALLKGYAEIDGPYKSERDAAKAAKGKPWTERSSLRNRRRG